jgi:hypothetical protein
VVANFSDVSHLKFVGKFSKKNQQLNIVEINPGRGLFLCGWTDEKTDGQS